MPKMQKLLYPALSLCFLLGMLGFFLGRRSVQGLILTTQHAAPTQALTRSLPADHDSPSSPAAQRVELNRATLEDLIALPGIGESRAQRIVEYREEHGPFSHTTELMNISGIGEGIYAKLREYVYVEELYEDTDH